MVVNVQVEADMTGAERKMGAQARDRGQYAMGNQMLADMQPYVPKKEGILRMTGHMTEDNESLIWDTPYAKRQFHMQGANYTTPGTGGRWDLVARGNHMADWERAWLKGAGF